MAVAGLTGCIEEEDEYYLETTLYLDDRHTDAMTVVQEQAREAGIDLELRVMEWGDFLEAVEEGEPAISYGGWSGSPSAADILSPYMPGAGFHWWGGFYENDDFTDLVKEAQRTPDDEERWEKYREAQEMLIEEDMGVFVTDILRVGRAYHETLEIPDEPWDSLHGPLEVLHQWELEEEETLEIAQMREPDIFCPIEHGDVPSQYSLMRIYESLVSTYPEGEPTTEADDAVAESYEISDDGLLYTFEIEEGIHFHNGDELTAEDVEFTINTMMMGEDETEEYQDMYDVEENPISPRDADFDAVDYVEATEEYTLEMHMEEVDAEIFQKGGFVDMTIVPKDYIEENGWEDFQDEQIGSGPFEFSHYEIGDELVLERNEDYRHEVNIPEVTYDFYDEESTIITALRAGDVHFTVTVSGDNYLDLQDEDQVITNAYQTTQHNRLAFNHEKEPFDDVNVRKALAYALDVEEIIKARGVEELYQNQRSPILEAHPTHHDELPQYEQDIEMAEELLEEAGYTR